MEKQKTNKYEKGIIITGIVLAIILLILLAADGMKNMRRDNIPVALSEQGGTITNEPNIPVLSAGMIPVKYDGDNLVITTKSDRTWYDYSNEKPAYMMLNDGVYQSELVVDMRDKKLASENIGQPVPEEEQGSIYMWIPRYEQNKDGEIKYVKEINYAQDGYEIPETFMYKQEAETSPDFLLTGIWVEKTPLTNANEVTSKIANMTGEENKYGFIANTIGVSMTAEDRETLEEFIEKTQNPQSASADSSLAQGSQGGENLPTLPVGVDAHIDPITDPTNTNRTVLKILNDKFQDSIKAKVEYNQTTGLIEATITYTKYGINKITIEELNKTLTLTNTNGIITANSSGISSEPGTYKIAITDKNGTTKKLKVKVPLVYGREVFGYECNVPNVTWRLFYDDEENIYLIADDYVLYENLPTGTKGTPLGKHSDYMAYMNNIVSDYTGSSWIKENTNKKAQKWLKKYLTAYPESTNSNIRAVAYMMDTKAWSNFAGDKAEYAIGGPTLEMFCASYKETHPEKYIECDSVNEYGYYVKWSNSSYTTSISGLPKDDYGSIYINGTNDRNIWFASPSASSGNVMGALYNGYLYSCGLDINALSFRPIVCLNSGTKLIDAGDETYFIKEPITAKAEYSINTKQIEVRVLYSDNEISKIMLNDTNELTQTNTNGITTANTAGISLEAGINTITITDKQGNTKTLEIKVKFFVKDYYGKEVKNYTCEAEGVETWRVFHVDDQNIYLIADDYVPYANLPRSTEGSVKPNSYRNDYKAYFTAILSKYTGSAWIRENTNPKAQNWLRWVNSYPSSENNNIKAVAYMMDTNSWSGFANSTYADYAIGGPTLELFCDSYKVTHPDKWIDCNSKTSNGYQVKWSNSSSYASGIADLILDDFESIYLKDGDKAFGMWLASPSDDGGVMSVNQWARMQGYTIGSPSMAYQGLAFRPVVCLKSGVKLLDNGAGTLSIQ